MSWAWILIFVLLVVFALIMAARRRDIPLILLAATQIGAVEGGGGSDHNHGYDPVGEALDDAINREDIYLGTEGGGVNTDGGGTKNWRDYTSWEQLVADKQAFAEYWTERRKFLKYPNVEWSDFYRELRPTLADNAEYIGVATIDENNRVKIVTYERAEMKRKEKGNIAAYIDSTLVNKYVKMPGFFIFHTHPAHEDIDPMPTSHDVSMAIALAIRRTFAATVVVSRFGILALTVAPDYVNEITKLADGNPKRGEILLNNYRFKVVSAHEAISCWRDHNIQEHIDFYRKHGILALNYPSPEFVAEAHAILQKGDPTERPDLDLLMRIVP